MSRLFHLCRVFCRLTTLAHDFLICKMDRFNWFLFPFRILRWRLSLSLLLFLRQCSFNMHHPVEHYETSIYALHFSDSTLTCESISLQPYWLEWSDLKNLYANFSTELMEVHLLSLVIVVVVVVVVICLFILKSCQTWTVSPQQPNCHSNWFDGSLYSSTVWLMF